MASEVIEKKIIQLELDKKDLATGLRKAMSDVDSFTSKLNGIKTTAFENIKSSVSGMSSSFSKLTDHIPIISTLKEHITNLGKSSGEAAIGLSQINQNGNFQAIISGSNDAARGVEHIGEATSNIGNKFSILEGAASVALGNIASKAISTAASIINNWTLRPIIDGYQEYERELDSTRILVSALGESETDHITAVMRDLEQYAKTTRYSSQEMNAATAQFVNAGIGLDESATALKGWGNLAASASASTADFNRTLETSVEQALQMGYMDLQNWRQIQNANMATKKFKDTIIDTAVAQGDVTGEIQAAIDKYGELNDQALNYLFNERLTEGKWFTNDVMMSALHEFANNPEMVKQAESLYTFKEALESTEEAVSDAWSKFWVEMVGKGDEAVAIWTPVGEIMQNIVSFIPNAMTEVAASFNQLEGRLHVIETIKAGWEKLTLVFNSFTNSFKNVFGDGIQNKIAEGIIHLFDRLKEKITGSEISVESLNQIFTAFWRIVKIGIGLVGALGKVLDLLIPNNLIQMGIDLISVFARLFNVMYDGLNTVLKNYVNASPIGQMFQAVRDNVRDFWDFVATIFGAIIDKATSIGSTFVQLGAHVTGFFGNTVKRLLGLGKTVDEAGRPIETFSQKFIAFQNELGSSYRVFHDVYGQTHSLTEAFREFGDSLLNMQHGGVITKLFGKIITDATKIKGTLVDTAHGAQLLNQEYHLSYEIISRITKGWELLKSKQDDVYKAFDEMRTSYQDFSPMERMYILAQKIRNIFDGRLFTDKLLNFTKWFTGIDGSIDKTTGKLARTNSVSQALGRGLLKVKEIVGDLFNVIKVAGGLAIKIIVAIGNHWEALLAPLVLVGSAAKALITVFSAVWDEANRVYDIMGRIKGFASGILSSGVNLFGELFFGSTVYADEIGGVSDAMEKNIPISERLGRGVDALGQKIMDSTAKFKTNAEAIANSASPIKALTSTFKSFGGKVLGFFNFKDFIAGLKGVGDESDVLKTKMGQLGTFLNKHIYGGWKNIVTEFKAQSITFKVTIQTVSGWIKEFVDNLDFSSKAEFIKSVFTGIGTTLKHVGEGITGTFGAIGGALGKFADAVGETISNISKWITDFAKSKALSNLLEAGTLITFIKLLKNFNKITDSLADTIRSFSRIPNGIADVLSEVGGVLKSYQKEIKAKSIREIATALLLMSGALFVISTIPTNKLLTSVTALATMATILVGAYTTIKMAQKKFGGSSSEGIMGNVVDALGLGEVNQLMKKIGKATMLISVATSLLLIIKPFKELAAMDWGEILQGVIAMGAVLTEIVGATWLSGLSKANLGTAATIYALGKVLKACVDIMKPLGEMDTSEYDHSLLKIAGIAAVIAGSVALMSGKFSFFKTGMADIQWGNVSFGTASTIFSLARAIRNIIDSFAVINQMSTAEIDSASVVIQRIAASIRNAIMLMGATLTLGTGGSTGSVKVFKKEIFSGLPQMGLKFSTGNTKWSLAATIASFTFAIKAIIKSFEEINKLNTDEIDKGVDTVNRIMRSLTLAIGAMSFSASLSLPKGFKASIGTGGMNWAQSLGIATFVAGLLFLIDQLDDLAEIDPKRLATTTNAVKTIADQLGMLFLAMNIGALVQNYMNTDLPTLLATIGMMGTIVVALKVVGDQLVQFSSLNSEQLSIAQTALFTVGGTITVMSTVLAGISVVMSQFANIAGIIETLALLGSVVLSLKIVGDQFMQFSGLDPAGLATAREALFAISLAITGMVAVLGVLGLAAGGVATINPMMLAGAAEVLLLLVGTVASIKIVGDEFIKLGAMDSGSIANARVALSAITQAIEGMVGVLGIFGLVAGGVGTLAPGVLVAIPETMSGAKKAAQAIAELGPTFISLGTMDTGSIARAKSAMKVIQNALAKMVETGFWESWFKNWANIKDKMSATKTAADAMKKAGSALEEIGTADVAVYQAGNSNLDTIKDGVNKMVDTADTIGRREIDENAVANAQLLRRVMQAIGDAFTEASTIQSVDTSNLQAAVNGLATSAVNGLTSADVTNQYNLAGQGLVTSARSGVDIMAPYMGDGGVLAAGSFVSGVQSGQISANQAGNLLTQMAQSGASAQDLYAVAQTLGGTYTKGIFSLNGQSYNVGSGLTSQANAGAGSGVGALAGTGRNVSSTFSGGISGSSGLASTAAGVVMEAAKTAFNATFGIASAGEAIVSALAGGIRGAIHKVKSAASDVMAAIKNFFPHSPAPEGPFSGKGWTAVKTSGLAVAKEWVSGLSEGFENNKEIENAIGQVQSAVTAVNDYAYDNLELTPTITPVVDMTGINAANLQLRNFKMGYNGVANNVSFSDLNQATMQAAQTRYTIDNVIEGMNIMNRKLEDISGKTDIQTRAIEEGHVIVANIDGKNASKQLAPHMSLAQQAYNNQLSRRKGQLPSIS